MHQQQTAFENLVWKGEIARDEQFLLFPQCFLLNQIIVSLFVHIFYISLFTAELPKIGTSGKGLTFNSVNIVIILVFTSIFHNLHVFHIYFAYIYFSYIVLLSFNLSTVQFLCLTTEYFENIAKRTLFINCWGPVSQLVVYITWQLSHWFDLQSDPWLIQFLSEDWPQFILPSPLTIVLVSRQCAEYW